MQRSRQLSGTNGWTNVQTTFSVPRGASHIEPMFVVTGHGTGYIDGMSVRNDSTGVYLVRNGGFEASSGRTPNPYWQWASSRAYSTSSVVRR